MAINDTVYQKILEREGCQWLGPNQDPRDGPTTICGHKVIQGKAYCEHHYPKVYMVGSSITKLGGRSAEPLRKNNKMTPEEIEDMFNEVVAELEGEGVL